MILEINSILFPSPRPKPFYIFELINLQSSTLQQKKKEGELFEIYLNERKADRSWFYVIQQR